MEEREPVFDAAFRAELHRLLAWRRDVRRFRRESLPDGAVERLLDLAGSAPSVGLSQPWRFVLVEDAQRRHAIGAEFVARNAEALAAEEGERARLYASLKLAGLDEAPVHLAVFADPATSQGHGLGRRTMPRTIEYSVVAAVQTLWIAARAEGIGVGWVSILAPEAVAAILEVPREWVFVAYLCLGFPAAADDAPELERAGWERRRPVAEFLFRR